MAYANSEKETTCVYDHEAKSWIIYTNVPRHMTKLLKSNGEPYWKEEESDSKGNPRMIAGKWKLKSNQVRFAKITTKKMPKNLDTSRDLPVFSGENVV